MDGQKLISLRRDDTCVRCRVDLPARTRAYWAQAQKTVTCLECAARAAKPPDSVAGSSARCEREKRRANREARARAKYGAVGAFFARLSDGRQHERAWEKGARGEELNARRLEKHLRGTPVRFLHDRRQPGRRSNIDHIAVGPGGVTIIDSKNIEGKVRVIGQGGLFSERRHDLYVGGRRRTALVEGVETQVALVRAALAEAGYPHVSVTGALCIADPVGLPWIGHPTLREIAIAGSRRVAKLIRREGDLTVEEIDAVTQALQTKFVPA